MFETKYHQGELAEKTFLITGGAGFIGSNIVSYLLKYGAKKVIVLDNLITGRKSNIEQFFSLPNFQFIEGDITDLATCQKACERIDYISHQAALGSVPRSIAMPFRTNEINVGGFVNMAFAAKEAGVKSFVYASSSSVYGDEKTLPKVENIIGNQLSPYAVSKYANELYAKVFAATYGLRMIGLRYFNIFGPNQDPDGQYAAVIPKFVDAILSDKEVFIDGDGEQSRDFTFVENAVQANVLAMLCDNDAAFNQIYNIACGDQFTVNQMYFGIASLLNSDKKPIYRDARQGDIRASLANIDKANHFFGYSPKFQFNDGLKITVDYFRELAN